MIKGRRLFVHCKSGKRSLKALLILNAEIKSMQNLELPYNRGTRHVIRLQPKSHCPSTYPRPIGIPKKKPLGNQVVDNLC